MALEQGETLGAYKSWEVMIEATKRIDKRIDDLMFWRPELFEHGFNPHFPPLAEL